MDKIFKVSVFGLAPNEQNTLGSIFKLAASRSRQYTMVSPTERTAADIILVDSDDTNAMNEWRSFSVRHSTIPVIYVTKTAPAQATNEVYLRRPLTLKRVLETLDKVAIVALKHVNIDIHDGGVPDDDEDAKSAYNVAVQSAEKTGVKALVVDDALSVRKAMEIHLGVLGVDIDFAETGEEALEYIQKTVYDIIFLDLMLPGIDGYKVCKEIKSHKLSKNTPVIMLTGKGSRFDKIKGTMAGANLFLTKPVEQEKLKEVIKQYAAGA
ncbi:MAG: hypothetical protein DRR08_04670 [Candidatus Parabeggiatoa sp. nov. 2]|nr:MAG: hypothetical protein B6247_12590 [Beggiatoa sp. 4572_84]RKZ62956.1 MAG: hypothetical protein DRR08_04670 [Gammaproteobacteria bacterium]HEC85466.1 response regulator [Thioploca sp.]